MDTTETVEWIRICWEHIRGYFSWENVKAFGNSNFFTALTGSLAGAFAGAYIAQRIAEKTKKREELLNEVRNTNAAIMLCHGICNSALSLKKQHVKSMKESFDSARAEFLEFKQKHQTEIAQGVAQYNVNLDLMSLPKTQLPVEMLQRQMFDKLSIGGRPLSAITTLIQTSTWLNESIERRNELIEELKSNTNFDNSAPLIVLYFGLPYKGSHVNRDYPDVIDAIYSYTDDVIFFSHLLLEDLNHHGNQLANKFNKLFGDEAPKINEASFELPKKIGLMPDEKNYSDWLNAFIKKT